MIQRENHKSEAIDVQRKSINTAFYTKYTDLFCIAPLQLNTQHNRYFTLPVGRAARSQQTITHDWGEGIMILLLPHASDGVTALGL